MKASNTLLYLLMDLSVFWELVIHRLDRLTSGVMILARSKARAQKLHEAMRNREMHKEYVCRVKGLFPE